MIEDFNALPAGDAVRDLLTCCASTVWAHEMAAGRPYRDLGAAIGRADAALTGLTWAEIAEALAAHPRIGDRPTGADREAAWSRREQAGMDTADDTTRAALRAANLAYEERFDHVFLIFATGRTDAEMLEAARSRLHNDAATERTVVREELRKIVNLRLKRLLTG